MEHLILPNDTNQKKYLKGLISSLTNNQSYNLLFRFNSADNNPGLCCIIKSENTIKINFLKPFDQAEILDKNEEEILAFLTDTVVNIDITTQKVPLKKPSSQTAKNRLSIESLLNPVDTFYQHGYLAHIAANMILSPQNLLAGINFTNDISRRKSDLALIRKLYIDFELSESTLSVDNHSRSIEGKYDNLPENGPSREAIPPTKRAAKRKPQSEQEEEKKRKKKDDAISEESNSAEQKEFMAACESGNLESVELLLKNPRFDVNKADQEGKTPFYRACEKGHMEVVELLLKDPRININQANKEGKTPLNIACKFCHEKVIEILLKDPRTNVNQPDKRGKTPLNIACAAGNASIAELLLEDSRIDVSKPGKCSALLFWLACAEGCVKVAKLLLKDPEINVNRPEKYNETPFDVACARSRVEIIKLLLKNPIINVNNANSFGHTSFYTVCRSGKVEIVELLLQDPRIDVNKVDNNGQTPFSVTGFSCWSQPEDLETKVVKIRTMILANALAKASEEQIRGFFGPEQAEQAAESFNENLLRFSKAVGLVGGNANSNLFNGVTPDAIIRELKKIADERAADVFAQIIFRCDDFFSSKELEGADTQANSNLKQDNEGSPSTSPEMPIGRIIQALSKFRQNPI